MGRKRGEQARGKRQEAKGKRQEEEGKGKQGGNAEIENFQVEVGS